MKESSLKSAALLSRILCLQSTSFVWSLVLILFQEYFAVKVSITENNQKAQEKIVVLNLFLFKDRLFLLQSSLRNAEYLHTGEKR